MCFYFRSHLSHQCQLISRSLLWLFLYENMGKACIRKLGESPSWYHLYHHPDKSLLPMLTCWSVWNNGDPRELYPQLKNGIQIFWSMPMVQTLNFAVIVAFCAAAGSAFLARYHPKHVLSLQAVEHGALSDGPVALQKHRLYRALAEPYLAAVSYNNNK